MRYLLMVMLFASLPCFGQNQVYTGRLEDLTATDRGIEFRVVVNDKDGNEVYRSEKMRGVGTGHQTVTEAVAQAKEVVQRKTDEIYAHVENAIEIIKNHKKELEDFRATCDKVKPVSGVGVID